MRLFALLFFQCSVVFLSGATSVYNAVQAEYVLVMNLDTGKILYAKNAEEKLYPASVTKIATLYFILSEYNPLHRLHELVTCQAEGLRYMSEQKKVKAGYQVPGYLLEPDGVKVHLKTGQKFPLLDMLSAFMILSPNDVGNQLALFFEPTIPAFMEKMNKALLGIGCKNTHFDNPHGLFFPTHMTTAMDLATICRRLHANSFAMELMRATFFDSTFARPIRSTNRLLNPESPFYCPHVFAAKTGYVHKAGFNMVCLVEIADRKFVIVCCKSPTKQDLYRDILHIINTVKKEKKGKRLLYEAKKVHFSTTLEGADRPIRAVLAKDIYLEEYPSESGTIQAKVEWKKALYPDIRKGAHVADIVIYEKEALLIKEPLFADEDVEATFLFRLRNLCRLN